MSLAKTIIFSVLISTTVIVWYDAVGIVAAYVAAGITLVYGIASAASRPRNDRGRD